MTEHTRILLIEDDTRLAGLIGDYLSGQGFSVATEERGDAGKRRILADRPDLVILDLMLPGMDGLTVCREVRSRYHGPILMLTAQEDDTNQIVGLEIGADDYVKKPVDPRVLLARIRMLLRRRVHHNHAGEGEVAEELVFGELRLDKTSQSVWLDGKVVDLTSGEFALLWLLATNSGQVLERETLYREVRGIPYDGVDRSVDIAISRLRRKLGDNSAKPFRIKTVWGHGYLFARSGW